MGARSRYHRGSKIRIVEQDAAKVRLPHDMPDYYAILERPHDYPDDYILRVWHWSAGDQKYIPGPIIGQAATVEGCRKYLPKGAVRATQERKRNAYVVECWI